MYFPKQHVPLEELVAEYPQSAYSVSKAERSIHWRSPPGFEAETPQNFQTAQCLLLAVVCPARNLPISARQQTSAYNSHDTRC